MPRRRRRWRPRPVPSRASRTGYGHHLSTAPAHEVFPIATTADPAALTAALDLHAAAKISYAEMSRALATAGIERWTFDTEVLTITYYDLAGTPVLSEPVN
ncbi:DUF1398 family protein [Kribbella italica]|uniref:DUF1398 family protein n=1 Tax=Kribbella italica TaxID=1540520 RepID=UPI001610A75F|nr:DUF1398 family protein [Kribbella italica]